MKKSEALQCLTLFLSPDYNDFADIYKKIEMKDDEWELVMKIANQHLLVPALYEALKLKGYLVYIENENMVAYMKEIYMLNEKRNKQILKQLQEIASLLYQKLGIKVVLLKGAAALSEGHYNTLGARAMMDIDILVPEDKIFASVDILKEYGYMEIDSQVLQSDNWHHYNRLYHQDKVASIEVHRYILKTNSSLMQEVRQEHLLKSQTIEYAYVLEPTYEVIHSFLHSQIAHNYHKYHYISLRHIHHFSILMQHYGTRINYKKILLYMNTNSLHKEWKEFSYMLQQLFLLKYRYSIDTSWNTQEYFYRVKLYLDISDTLFRRTVVVYLKVMESLNYYKLQEHYGFTNKKLTPLYALIHLPVMFYIFVTNKRKRKVFLQNIYIFSI